MKHPSIDKLALFAGGELSPFEVWKLRRHIGACAQCQEEVRLFSEGAAVAAQETDTLPPHLNWERLAAEMRANIRLGLEASDAIRSYGPASGARALSTEWSESGDWEGESNGWNVKMAVAATVVGVLVSMAWWWNAVRKAELEADLRGSVNVLVEASGRGVGLSAGGSAIELKSPVSPGRAAIVTVSTMGTAGTQYVDEETGQVTVNNVYVE